MKKIVIFTLFLILFSVFASAITINVNPSNKKQVLLGTGGNLDSSAGHDSADKEIIQDLGITFARTGITRFSQWEEQNDNSDPYTINWDYFNSHFNSLSSNSGLKKEIESMKYYENQGMVIYYSIWSLPCWIDKPDSCCVDEKRTDRCGGKVDQKLDSSAFPEVAESITSYLLYLKKQGISVDYFSVNEPQMGISIGMGPSQLKEFYVVLANMFNRYNVNTKISLPETGALATPYANFFGYVDLLMQTMKDNGVQGSVGALGYHGYDVAKEFHTGGTEYLDSIQRAKSKAEEYNLPLIVGEYGMQTGWIHGFGIIMDSSTKDYGFNMISFALEMYSKGGVSVSLPWTIDGGAPMRCCDKYGNAEQSLPKGTKFPIYYYYKLLNSFLPPGTRYVDTSDNGDKTYTAAFVDPNNKVVVAITSESSDTINLDINGIGSTTLKRYETTGNGISQKDDVQTSNGRVTISVPSESLTVLSTGSIDLQTNECDKVGQSCTVNNCPGRYVDSSGNCVCTDVAGDNCPLVKQECDKVGQSCSVNNCPGKYVDSNGNCVCTDVAGDNCPLVKQECDKVGQSCTVNNCPGKYVDSSGNCVCRDVGGDNCPLLNVEKGIRINAGGPSYTDNNGNLWFADQEFDGSFGYVGGWIGEDSEPIANTDDDVLYQTERYGLSSYKFSVPNGNYNVNLLFDEFYFDKTDKRIFDVNIEGKKVLDDFEILTEAARWEALQKSYSVKVNDGVLNIDFMKIPNKNVPKISAIEILPFAKTTVSSTTSMKISSYNPRTKITVNKKVYINGDSVFLQGKKVNDLTIENVQDAYKNNYNMILFEPNKDPINYVDAIKNADQNKIIVNLLFDESLLLYQNYLDYYKNYDNIIFTLKYDNVDILYTLMNEADPSSVAITENQIDNIPELLNKGADIITLYLPQSISQTEMNGHLKSAKNIINEKQSNAVVLMYLYKNREIEKETMMKKISSLFKSKQIAKYGEKCSIMKACSVGFKCDYSGWNIFNGHCCKANEEWDGLCQ